MNDKVPEVFLKKMDNLFKIWEKAKEGNKEGNKEIIMKNFLKDLNSEEIGYFIKFCEEGNKFLEIIDKTETRMKEANIKPSHKNTVKIVESEFFGYEVEDLREIKE